MPAAGAGRQDKLLHRKLEGHLRHFEDFQGSFKGILKARGAKMASISLQFFLCWLPPDEGLKDLIALRALQGS